jgi:hypothetical protein
MLRPSLFIAILVVALQSASGFSVAPVQLRTTGVSSVGRREALKLRSPVCSAENDAKHSNGIENLFSKGMAIFGHPARIARSSRKPFSASC